MNAKIDALNAIQDIVQTFGKVDGNKIAQKDGVEVEDFFVPATYEDEVNGKKPFNPYLLLPIRGQSPSITMLLRQLNTVFANALMGLTINALKYTNDETVKLPMWLMVALPKGKVNGRHLKDVKGILKYMVKENISILTFKVDTNVNDKSYGLAIESNLKDLLENSMSSEIENIKDDSKLVLNSLVDKIVKEGYYGFGDEAYEAISEGFNKLARRLNKGLKIFLDLNKNTKKLLIKELPKFETIDPTSIAKVNETFDPYNVSITTYDDDEDEDIPLYKASAKTKEDEDVDEDDFVPFSAIKVDYESPKKYGKKVVNTIKTERSDNNKQYRGKNNSKYSSERDEYPRKPYSQPDNIDDGVEYEEIEVPVYGELGLQVGTKMKKVPIIHKPHIRTNNRADQYYEQKNQMKNRRESYGRRVNEDPYNRREPYGRRVNEDPYNRRDPYGRVDYEDPYNRRVNYRDGYRY